MDKSESVVTSETPYIVNPLVDIFILQRCRLISVLSVVRLPGQFGKGFEAVDQSARQYGSNSVHAIKP